MKMRVRASKAQTAHSTIKRKLGEAKKACDDLLEAERKRRAEAADNAAASAMIAEANELVDAATAATEKSVTAIEAFVKAPLETESPMDALEEAEAGIKAAVESINKAKEKITKTNIDQIKTVTKGPFVMARGAMFKLKPKFPPLEAKCTKALGSLKVTRTKMCVDAQEVVERALRGHAQSANLSPDTLFNDLSQGSEEISVEALRKHLEGIEGDSKLKKSELDIGLHRYRTGVTKLGLLGMFHEYKRCVKEIALTTEAQMKGGNSIRKLEVGELVEILSGRSRDDTVGVERVNCRSIKDFQEGWVTVRGNQGTAFLERAGKPYVVVQSAAPLSEACKADSTPVRDLRPGELLEVTEGPRPEPTIDVERVKGKCAKDNKVGWLSMNDAQGPVLELQKVLVCKGSIAITDGEDIGACKAIRKLDIGETCEQMEQPVEDPKRKLTRVKVKCNRDGIEGWATMKGNQGTAYIAESTKHHILRRAVELESAFPSGSKVLREVAEGELFEVVEGPTTEKKEGALRLRGRSMAGEVVEGWFSADESVAPWCTSLECSQATDLHDSVDASSGKVLRSLVKGEALEALAAPVREESTGILRVRVRAEKDGVIGFASTTGDKGVVHLEPVFE